MYSLAFHQGNYNIPQPHYIVSGFGSKNQSFFNNNLLDDRKNYGADYEYKS